MEKTQMDTNRDFVDFIIDIVENWKLFLIFLIILVSLASYYDRFKNLEYSMTSTIKVSSQSKLMPIINNFNTYISSEDVSMINTLQESVTYQEFATDICGIVRSSFIDTSFFESLADDYINKSSDQNFDRSGVINEFRAALSNVNVSDQSNCLIVEASSRLNYVEYLKKYYAIMLNEYITKEISERLKFIRQGKIDFLTKSLESINTVNVDKTREEILSQLELNALEERSLAFNSKLSLVTNTQVVDTNISYFMNKDSNIQKKLGSVFIYAFSIFLSVTLHVIAIVLIDFQKQYIFRKKTK